MPNSTCSNKNVSAFGSQEIKVMPVNSGVIVTALLCLNCKTIVGVLPKK